MSGPESPAPVFSEVFCGNRGYPRWELEQWGGYGVVAGVTAAGPGAEIGLLDQLALPERESRWQRLISTWGPDFHSAVISRQVHGDEVAVVRAPEAGLTVVGPRDGHVTMARGVLLTVSVADCVPVYLAVPGRGVVGLLHSGWRGTAAGIVARGVGCIREITGVAAPDVVMHCGVSVCGDCYEVDAAVATRVTGAPHESKVLVDLRAELVRQGRSLGIENVTVSDHCTVHEPDSFYSHRASGGLPSRMVAYLGIPGA